jgi:hypothetical protein
LVFQVTLNAFAGAGGLVGALVAGFCVGLAVAVGGSVGVSVGIGVAVAVAVWVAVGIAVFVGGIFVGVSVGGIAVAVGGAVVAVGASVGETRVGTAVFVTPTCATTGNGVAGALQAFNNNPAVMRRNKPNILCAVISCLLEQFNICAQDSETFLPKPEKTLPINAKIKKTVMQHTSQFRSNSSCRRTGLYQAISRRRTVALRRIGERT